MTEFAEDSAEYGEAWDAVVNAKQNNHEVFDVDCLGLAALDISIKDDLGNVIEPAEGAVVTVNLQIKELPEGIDEETLSVQHLNEQKGIVETVAESSAVTVSEGSATAVFTTDSFSTYTITWSLPSSSASDANASFRLRFQSPNQNYQNGYYQNVRIWYVDESGNNLQKPAGRNDVVYNSNNYPNVTIDLSEYNTLSGYEFVEARYSGNTNNKPNGQVIDSVQFIRNGNNRIANYIYDGSIISTNTRTSTTGNDTGNVYLVYRSSNQRTITVHYGYMDGNNFVEFDSLPDGAQSNYGPPAGVGDQLNLRYEIEGKDYVTTRLGNPSTGTQISPLLQTSPRNATNDVPQSYSQYPYWRYRELSTLTVGGGINQWLMFPNNDEDLYVIYRDTPTEKSYDDNDLDPEDLSAPATNKDVNTNNDGTYDISLSVTGTSNSMTNKTHANVVIVLDTSSSMDGTDTGVPGQTRLQAAQNAICDVLADELFGFNTADDPKAIEIAFVDFSHRVRNEMTKDTIYSGVKNGEDYTQFIRMIRGLSDNGGTNYDTAIEAANSVLWDDADPVYVIFVTDGDTVSRGYLEYNENGDTYPADWDGGTYYNGAGVPAAEYYARARSAAQVQVNKILADANNRFYSIGVFGNVQYLEQLGGTYLGQANNETRIRQAFATIIDEIAMNLGYEDVTIHDGLTALTSTHLVNGNVNEFHYKVKTKDGTETEYADGAALQAAYPGIGLASYDAANKTVNWDMGDQYMLEDGVTYTVSFTVWPSQTAYDLVADLNNGIKRYAAGYDNSITDAERAQIIEISAPTETTQGSYSLKTNTSATIDYTSVKIVDGVETERNTVTGAEIKDPNGKMPLTGTTMRVAKQWLDELDVHEHYPVTFYIWKDGVQYDADGEIDTSKAYYTINLPKDGAWESEISIAPGLIKDGEILETGHNYTVTETHDPNYYYDFVAETVRPMLMNSSDDITKLTKLVRDDGTVIVDGGDPIDLDNVDGEGQSTYVVVDTGDYSDAIVGRNVLRGGINVRKQIVDADGNVISNSELGKSIPDIEYTFRATFNLKDREIKFADYTAEALEYEDGESHPGSWFTDQTAQDGTTYRIDGNAYPIWVQISDDGGVNWRSGGMIQSGEEIRLKASQLARFTNVPAGTTYTLTEVVPLGAVYNFYSVAGEINAAGTIPWGDGDFVINGSTISGRIVPNAENNITYKNQYPATTYDVTKVWDDANNSAGIRPSSITLQLQRSYTVDGETLTEDVNDLLTVGIGTKAVNTLSVRYDLDGDGIYTDRTDAQYMYYQSADYQWIAMDGAPAYSDLAADAILSTRITAGTSVDNLPYTSQEPYVVMTVSDDGNSWLINWLGLEQYKIIDDQTYEYTYSVKEVNVDVHYSSRISADGRTITNTIARKIRFRKTDMQGNGLDGAVFEFDFNGTTYTLTSDGDDDGLMKTADGTSVFQLTINDAAYELEETNAPAGYLKLTGNVQVFVTNNSSNPVTAGRSDDSTVQYDVTFDESTGIYTVTITNSAGAELPKTGGSGTLPYTLGGFSLIMGAALMYILRMRRERRLS